MDAQDSATISTPPTGADAPVVEPVLIAGKFKTQDDLLAAYKALEAKLGAPKEAPATTLPADPAPAAVPPADLQEPATQPATEPVKVPEGVNLNEFSAEYDKEGKLGEESYAKLAAQGLNRETVDTYIAGQRAIADATSAKLFDLSGGEEQFNAMLAWAGDALSPEQAEAFNEAVMGPGAELAVRGLASQYATAVGTQPTLLTAEKTTPVSGYQGSAEMVADMSDPRYQAGDVKWHAMVDRKIKAGAAAGTI